MSAAAAAISVPTPTRSYSSNYSAGRRRCSTINNICFYRHGSPLLNCRSSSSSESPIRYTFFSNKPHRRRTSSAAAWNSPVRPLSVVMEWQDCTCYSDREAIPKWMPFISSVEILKDKPELSKWSLKYNAFGQDIEFSWLARNMQPTLNQKIHWRSMEGLPNRGAVRFFPKGPSSCVVELTVSYEVPQLLAPVASALQPFLKSLLERGLERFARFAMTYKPG
ncbi:uncharacterized protein LOC124914879 isoform X2 [Impatiens glandulifera]|uniref:uncharacterized protein LOC124914879 isoform X2 n=1 Tax=Impatiens glandulifera TaxID=253017 RepID=UPI001FB14FB1|nr:uncharacterized protein LOC124914879 isoform X2 [Impatiens glandulifera]